MSLGSLEQVALSALSRFKGDAHGAGMILEIESRTGRSISPGALYTVLNRLEQKGFVQGWIGEATPQRGGRRRKMYRLLPSGAQALIAWQQDVEALAHGTQDYLLALAQEGV